MLAMFDLAGGQYLAYKSLGPATAQRDEHAAPTLQSAPRPVPPPPLHASAPLEAAASQASTRPVPPPSLHASAQLEAAASQASTRHERPTPPPPPPPHECRAPTRLDPLVDPRAEEPLALSYSTAAARALGAAPIPGRSERTMDPPALFQEHAPAAATLNVRYGAPPPPDAAEILRHTQIALEAHECILGEVKSGWLLMMVRAEASGPSRNIRALCCSRVATQCAVLQLRWATKRLRAGAVASSRFASRRARPAAAAHSRTCC
jgi:hypothetical protein